MINYNFENSDLDKNIKWIIKDIKKCNANIQYTKKTEEFNLI